MEDQESPNIGLASICEATNNFSELNKLGQGGFGPVYKVLVSLTKHGIHDVSCLSPKHNIIIYQMILGILDILIQTFICYVIELLPITFIVMSTCKLFIVW